MCVVDRARDFGHEPGAIVGPTMQRRDGRAQASAARVFHAEERQAVHAFTYLIDGQNVWMVEFRRHLRFALEPDQRFVRVAMIRQHTFQRDDATRVFRRRAR